MNRPRALITGGGGQLASDLAKALPLWDVQAPAHAQLDICDAQAVREALEAFRPQVVINTAAFHRVDDCETEVERAFAVNFRGVLNLCLACRATGAVLLHLSTDYVFDGKKRQPYLETDLPNPINVYGLSKLAGEAAIMFFLERYFIVRTSGLFGAAGASGKGGNFVNTMLRKAREGAEIAVVNDQRLSPTYTRHLAEKIAWLLASEVYGIYHMTNSDSCTWYEFAVAILDLAGLSADLRPTTTAAFGARARRPAYSVLGHGGLLALDADDMSPWRDGLRAYLEEIGVIDVSPLLPAGATAGRIGVRR